jgi:hypothetical protein
MALSTKLTKICTGKDMIIVISNELVYQDPTAQYFMISFFLFFQIHELGGLATFQKKA